MKHINTQTTQKGVSLIELLVGIAIGLLTITVAMGALMASRNVSGSVSDVSQIQQQAAYAFRDFGRQLRQAGSLRLNLAPQKISGEVIDVADPVAFETAVSGFTPSTDSIVGIDAPSSSQYKLTVGYRNYTEPVFSSSTEESLQRNCLGQQNSLALIQSRFTLNTSTNELQCAGSSTPQPFVQNVANFEVRYLVQTDPAPFGNPQLQYINAAAVTAAAAWPQVQGVEICLVLYGNEVVDMPSGTTYKDCDGTTSVNITTLSSPRKNRVHMAFRSVYQLRSQGLAG